MLLVGGRSCRSTAVSLTKPDQLACLVEMQTNVTLNCTILRLTPLESKETLRPTGEGMRRRWVRLALRTHLTLFLTLAPSLYVSFCTWVKKRHADRLGQFLHRATRASTCCSSTTAVTSPSRSMGRSVGTQRTIAWDEVSARRDFVDSISATSVGGLFVHRVQGRRSRGGSFGG